MFCKIIRLFSFYTLSTVTSAGCVLSNGSTTDLGWSGRHNACTMCRCISSLDARGVEEHKLDCTPENCGTQRALQSQSCDSSAFKMCGDGTYILDSLDCSTPCSMRCSNNACDCSLSDVSMSHRECSNGSCKALDDPCTTGCDVQSGAFQICPDSICIPTTESCEDHIGRHADTRVYFVALGIALLGIAFNGLRAIIIRMKRAKDQPSQLSFSHLRPPGQGKAGMSLPVIPTVSKVLKKNKIHGKRRRQHGR